MSSSTASSVRADALAGDAAGMSRADERARQAGHTKKSGTSGAPGVTAYFVRSVMPTDRRTSSSTQNWPVYSVLGRVRITCAASKREIEAQNGFLIEGPFMSPGPLLQRGMHLFWNVFESNGRHGETVMDAKWMSMPPLR